MSEKYIGGPEKRTETLENAAAERSIELKRQQESKETRPENERKSTIEKARSEASSEALFSKEYSSERKTTHTDSEPRLTTSLQRKEAYKTTMNHIQRQMKPAERALSRVIHNPVVERVSEAVGSTIARPNAILYGSLFAFLGVAGIYMYARFAGFALSGFETIAAFIIGWIVGLLVDFFRVMISGKR